MSALKPIVGGPASILLLAACGCLALLAGCHGGSGDGGGGITPPDPVFPMYQEAPAWSSTGLIAYRDNGVVYVNEHGGGQVDQTLAGLWIIDPATGLKQRISPIGFDPTWSPDGSHLAFTHLRQVYVVASDGSSPRQITSGYSNTFPCWSPDSAHFAFDSNQHGSYEIWLMDHDGGNRMFVGPSSGGGRSPGWFPDGSNLVYVQYQSEGHHILTMTTAGTGGEQLTFGEREYWHPRVSPDGTRIACSGQDLGSVPQLWLMNADGSDLRPATSAEHGAIWPSWSPDGKELVYCSANTSRDDPTFGVLWTVDLGTGEERQLTTRWFD